MSDLSRLRLGTLHPADDTWPEPPALTSSPSNLTAFAEPMALAYATADVPGVGGVIKQRPEDFLVEEQPLYAPSGQGEHLYLFIEKRQLTTTDVVRRIAKALYVKRQDVGFAGLKDKHAITRQHLSVYMPGREPTPEQLDLINCDRCRLLWVDRHDNKLRRGHHGGNRFVIRIRNVRPEQVIHVRCILDQLQRTGLPNYLGEQRFGYRANNHLLGRLLLQQQWQALLDEMLGHPRDNESEAMRQCRQAYMRRDYAAALEAWPRSQRHERQPLDALRQGKSPEQAIRMMDKTQRQFLISAAQSAVFNAVLAQRVIAGAFGRLLPGDLAWKHDSRALFSVDEQTAELENGSEGRATRGEVSPSGPMWGRGMTQAAGQVQRMEQQALEDFGLRPDHFDDTPFGPVQGTRRPLRERLTDPDLSAGVDEHGPFIRVAFQLDRGVFATTALREIMKAPMAAET